MDSSYRLRPEFQHKKAPHPAKAGVVLHENGYRCIPI